MPDTTREIPPIPYNRRPGIIGKLLSAVAGGCKIRSEKRRRKKRKKRFYYTVLRDFASASTQLTAFFPKRRRLAVN